MIALNDCGPEILQLATNYAADYLNYVENLPFDLQRKVTKLREIDLKCREYVKEIEQLYENFKKENDGNGTVRRRSYLLQIRRLFGLCKELGDEKISIVQSLSEVIESRNKQLEYGRKRFQYAYEPNVKSEHGGKKEKDLKSDSSRGHKRSRRQRNNNSLESKEKILHYNKDQDKTSRSAVNDNTDEPTSKIFASLTSPEQGSPTAIPALTRAALREEDKRINNKTKDKKDEKVEKDEDKAGSGVSGGKNATETVVASTASASTSSSSRGKNGASAVGGASTKGKKKKRKSNKYQTERHASNSGEVSPLIDVPIDPYEPTYCLCQQVSFGQMIGCDNPKCPIEWFHFSCVRLTHKPKGKWYCPDCTIKRKRENKRADNR